MFEDNWQSGKIYNYDWYSIESMNSSDEVMVRWDNGLNCTDTEGVMTGDEIHLNVRGAEVIFRIFNNSTAFMVFYDDGKAYVKQLTKERDDPTVICS